MGNPLSTRRLGYQHWMKVVIWATVIAAVLFLVAAPQGQAAPSRQGVLHQVYISDVRDGQFVVSWTTDTASDGRVDWGTTTALGSTTSDPVASTTTHYVEINTGLLPNTLYYFQVTSGSTTNNNGGAFFTVTTGPTLGIPPAGKSLYGYVYGSDGITPVPNAIVYLQLQNADSSGSTGNSQWVTARTDGTGGWFFSNLNDVRTSNAGSYFVFSDGTDNLRINTQGGVLGNIGETGALRIVAVPTVYPAQFDTTLDGVPNAVTLVSFRAGQTGMPMETIFAIAILLPAAVVIFRRIQRH